MKNSIMRWLLTPRVALVRPDLHLEALARPLQRLDELHRVVRMHVVVGGAVVDQQPALQVLSRTSSALPAS